MKNRNLPASPESITSTLDNALISGNDIDAYSGLTKLETAAISAMGNLTFNASHVDDFRYIAEKAVKFANALFDELERAND